MDDRTIDFIFAGSLESLPPVSSKIVRIFTSSTFTGRMNSLTFYLSIVLEMQTSETGSSSNQYLEIQFLSRRKHTTSHYKYHSFNCTWGNNCLLCRVACYTKHVNVLSGQNGAYSYRCASNGWELFRKATICFFTSVFSQATEFKLIEIEQIQNDRNIKKKKKPCRVIKFWCTWTQFSNISGLLR
jgi:hypothetical protein